MRTTITRSHYPVRPLAVDPFADFDSLVRSAFGAARAAGFQPAVETVRDGDDAVVRLELPGVDFTRDVTVEVKGRDLVIAGERRDQREEQDTGRRVSEFRYGAFRRVFRLGAAVKPEAVSASYDAGVLSVRVAGAYAEDATHQVTITPGASVPAVAEQSGDDES